MKTYRKKDILLTKLKDHPFEQKTIKAKDLYDQVRGDFKSKTDFENALLELKSFYEIYYQGDDCAILRAGTVRLSEGGYILQYKASHKHTFNKIAVNAVIVLAVFTVTYWIIKGFIET